MPRMLCVNLDVGKYVTKKGQYHIKIGEFGDLWEAEYAPPGEKKRVVAVKQLRGAPAQNQELIDSLREKLEDAGSIWRELNHPNICVFIGLCFSFGYLPALVLEYHKHGNVMEFLKQAPAQVNRLKLIYNVACGLEYLHSKAHLHGDIRGFNILVKDDGVACLTDYGLNFIIDQAEFTRHKIAGPARWSAPELLDPPETDDFPPSPYTQETDIWAFGMTCIEIVTGSNPFNERKNDSAVIFHVLKGGRPNMPELLNEHREIAEAVRKCWDLSPAARPRASDVVSILENTLGFSQFEVRTAALIAVNQTESELIGRKDWLAFKGDVLRRIMGSDGTIWPLVSWKGS